MYAHDSALAPLVRGTVETLSPLRPLCSLADIINALSQGAALETLLPVHPVLPAEKRPTQTKIFLAFGAKVHVEVTAALPESARLVSVDPVQAQALLKRGAIPVLLGLDENATLRLGILAEEYEAEPVADTTAYSSDPRQELSPGTHNISLREWAHYLDDDDTQSALMMTALAHWHSHNHYCSKCGHANSPTHSGWVRECSQCHSLEYPRQDPAVIMAVTDERNRILLAHNVLWAPRRVSVLAGFVDAGEAPENTVTREIWEEVSIRVDRVVPAGTQPWPFPRSLMFAYTARVAEGTDSTLCPDTDEIEWAKWYSPEDLRRETESGQIILPGRNTIAHGMIRRWYGAPLPVAQATS